MANKTIKQLATEVTSISTDDWFLIQKDADNETAKIKAENIYANQYFRSTIALRAYRNAALTIGGGPEIVVCDVENFDVGSNYNTTTGAFTAPITGHYQINAQVTAVDVDVGGSILCYIYVNDVAYAIGRSGYTQASTNDPRSAIGTLAYVPAGQTVKLYVDCASTEALGTGSENTFLSIYLVGAA